MKDNNGPPLLLVYNGHDDCKAYFYSCFNIFQSSFANMFPQPRWGGRDHCWNWNWYPQHCGFLNTHVAQHVFKLCYLIIHSNREMNVQAHSTLKWVECDVGRLPPFSSKCSQVLIVLFTSTLLSITLQWEQNWLNAYHLPSGHTGCILSSISKEEDWIEGNPHLLQLVGHCHCNEVSAPMDIYPIGCLLFSFCF